MIVSPGAPEETIIEEKVELGGDLQDSPGEKEVMKKGKKNKKVDIAERLKTLQIWLDENYKGAFLMPSDESGKKPKYRHKEGQYDGKKFLESGYKEVEDGCLLGLSEDLMVVDVDDEEWCEMMESMSDEFSRTVCCKTSKGKHYYFRKTEEAREAGIKDSVRRLVHDGEVVPIDIKNVTATGTSGMISIPPSVNKKWIRELGVKKVLDIPRRFVEYYKTNNKDAIKDANMVTVPSIFDTGVNNMSKELKLDEIRQLVSLLSVRRADNYEDWMRVGWCLYNMYPDDLLEEWKKFSKRSEKYKEGECDRLWDDMKLPRGGRCLKLGSLHMWAKEDNQDKYRDINYYKYFDVLKRTDCTHGSLAKVFKLFYSRDFVSSVKTWYYFNGNLWEEDEEKIMLLEVLSNEFKNLFMRVSYDIATKGGGNEEEEDKNSKCVKRMLNIVKSLESITFKELLTRELKIVLYKKGFTQLLDKDPNLLAFRNGVWNLKENMFRRGLPEDLLSLSVGYDYRQKVDKYIVDEIEMYFRHLHPDDKQREYVIKMIARQLYGDSGGELFHIHAGHMGSAGNGKSKFFEILEHVLGDYIEKFGVELLITKQRHETSRPNPELDSWQGRRIIYCSEPNKDDVINSGTMKELTGGEKLKYRLLFSNKMDAIKPMYKMHIMCNDAPAIDGTDMGVRRRIRKIDYISKFVDEDEVDEENHCYQKDSTFMEDIRDYDAYKLEFLRYLLNHYNHKFTFKAPESVIYNSSSYMEENNIMLGFVKESLEYKKGEFCCLKDIKNAFRNSDYYDSKFKITTLKRELEKALKQQCVEQKRYNNRLYSYVFENYKIVDRYVCDEEGTS